MREERRQLQELSQTKVAECQHVSGTSAERGRQLFTRIVLSGKRFVIRSVAFSRDGRHIVTASPDKTARVWEADTGRLVAELKRHGMEFVEGAAFSPDGRHIVTASADTRARVWEADTGHLLRELKGHGDQVRSAAFSPDGRHIVTASADKTARIWDPSAEPQDVPPPIKNTTLVRMLTPTPSVQISVIPRDLPCSLGQVILFVSIPCYAYDVFRITDG